MVIYVLGADKMKYLIQELRNNKKFIEYSTNIKNKISPIELSGLTDVGKAQIISATAEENKRPILIITYNEIKAKKLLNDLKYFTTNVDYFPKREIVAYDYEAESKDVPYERIEVLNKIKQNKAEIIITTIEALMQKMISKELLYKYVIQFKVGNTYNLEEIKQNLIQLGYDRNDLVENKGQFSVRGGIIDIGLTEKQGIRIEFWGDEVDSIRSFDVESQSDEVKKRYGLHYNFSAVAGDYDPYVQNLGSDYNILSQDIEGQTNNSLCPEGWHIPTSFTHGVFGNYYADMEYIDYIFGFDWWHMMASNVAENKDSRDWAAAQWWKSGDNTPDNLSGLSLYAVPALGQTTGFGKTNTPKFNSTELEGTVLFWVDILSKGIPMLPYLDGDNDMINNNVSAAAVGACYFPIRCVRD